MSYCIDGLQQLFIVKLIAQSQCPPRLTDFAIALNMDGPRRYDLLK